MEFNEFKELINNKFKAFPTWKKVITISLLLLILVGLFLLVTQKRIDTIKYNTGCTEKFVNDKIEGDYCTKEREEINKSFSNKRSIYQINISADMKDLNYTLNLSYIQKNENQTFKR